MLGALRAQGLCLRRGYFGLRDGSKTVRPASSRSPSSPPVSRTDFPGRLKRRKITPLDPPHSRPLNPAPGTTATGWPRPPLLCARRTHPARPTRPSRHIRRVSLRRHSQPLRLGARWRRRTHHGVPKGANGHMPSAVEPPSSHPTPPRGPPRPRCPCAPRHSGAPRHSSSAAPLATPPSHQASFLPHGPHGPHGPLGSYAPDGAIRRARTHPMAPSGVLLEGRGAPLRGWCRGPGVRCPGGPWL